MKALSVIGLLFGAAIIAAVPVSPQVTPRGIEVSVDQAQAQVTYGRARRVARRADRRSYRYARRAGYAGRCMAPALAMAPAIATAIQS